jgi:hypothetical protein
MYSWKNARIVCTLLLLLPLVHLAWLLSRDVMATLDASPKVWADEMEAYIAADTAMHLPTDPIVVVGGRRVKLWPGLGDLLAPRPVLMRGLGNATVNDITYYYERLIGYYQPETVVLLPDNSEFHIRDAKSPEELLEAIKGLVKLDGAHEVTSRFYVFSPLKTPRYPGDAAMIEKSTELLEQWAAGVNRVTILDANPLLCRADGRPNPGFYRTDGVNLNEHGYLRLSVLLEQQLLRDRDSPHGFAVKF